jgi:hypothetical protein
MPPKRSDASREHSDHTLRMGKFNNFVAWLEIIKADAGALYGSTARFLTTNVRYVPRIPIEADYNPAIPEVEGQPAPPALTAAAIGKLREGAYDRRNKSIEQQLKDEEKLFNYVELRPSAASLAKIKEEATYDQISLDQDVIGLWGLIRRTHLTHIYGEGDPLMEVNVKEQEIRYANLKQGEREYISMFKTRFDNQVKANRGAGIAEITESKRALDFIYMLDQKRFGKMRMGMHNNALRRAPDAYPATLADAYRIASGWANEEPDRGSHGIESYSAFVTDESALVTKGKIQKKGKSHSPGMKSGEKARKSSSLIICYVCGVSGHYARDCSLKKDGDKILVAGKGVSFAEEDEEFYEPVENGYGAIYVTTEIESHDIPPTEERILFCKYDVQIDSQASLSLFKTRSLLRNLGPSAKRIIVNGVQADAEGVIVDQEGHFDQLGKVYYSPESTANILSYAAMVDAGHDVSYDGQNDRFLLRPLGSKRVLTFSRKRVDGSENRFYCCNMTSIIGTEPPTPPVHRILLGTVTENMKLYTML